MEGVRRGEEGHGCGGVEEKAQLDRGVENAGGGGVSRPAAEGEEEWDGGCVHVDAVRGMAEREGGGGGRAKGVVQDFLLGFRWEADPGEAVLGRGASVVGAGHGFAVAFMGDGCMGEARHCAGDGEEIEADEKVSSNELDELCVDRKGRLTSFV